ncbi:MAG: phosphoserine phosphatase SerB [Gammaproteobacteria bacterium]|nr:MAG: phosphoserine phosphatase SerB [Gammaproteobacteria bacterium]
MSYTTIIHASSLTNDEEKQITGKISGELIQREGYYRLIHSGKVERAMLEQLRVQFDFDLNCLPESFNPEEVGLLITDMDSTLIAIECIDEIADMQGIKAEVSEITEAAMRGELDFAASLKKRVALLAGLPADQLQRVYDERLRLNPGADKMLAGLKQKGIKTALVSGGFTFFTNQLKGEIGLDYTLANTLEIENGKLTGRVSGDIVGAEAKAALLQSLCKELGITTNQVIAMGDGANDLLMLEKAGLSVAYHAKPAVREATSVAFDHSGLEGVCHLLQL